MEKRHYDGSAEEDAKLRKESYVIVDIAFVVSKPFSYTILPGLR